MFTIAELFSRPLDGDIVANVDKIDIFQFIYSAQFNDIWSHNHYGRLKYQLPCLYSIYTG